MSDVGATVKDDSMPATRRTLLKKISHFLGAASAAQLTAGSAFSVAAAFKPQAPGAMSAGKIFTQAEMKTLSQLCALVLPATDTPSAADLDVQGFIDNQLFHCHSPAEHEMARDVLNEVEQAAHKSHQSTFQLCTSLQQNTLLGALDQGRSPFNKRSQTHFHLLKGLLVFGYFTSEVGATRALRYQAIPGGYRGSIPYKPGDRAWGSIARL